MDSGHGITTGRPFLAFKFIILLCLTVLVSCGYRSTPTQENPITISSTHTPSVQPSSINVPHGTDTPNPTPPQAVIPGTPPHETPGIAATATPAPYDHIATLYELDATLDYRQHWLSVHEAISITNHTPDTLNDLTLIVEPNRWPGGFTLLSLAWENGADIAQYTLQDDQLHFALPQALPPEGQGKLELGYELLLPEIPPPSDTERPQPYGYTGRQTNIVEWYPYLPPYKSGEGWLIHQHAWFGENQVFEVAEFQVQLSLSEPVPDLVIAASAPAQQVGDTYTYHLENARTFALSASDAYLVQRTTAGEVTVYSYTFPYDKYPGQEALHNTADALQLYSQLLTPYPHTTLSIVEADFLDGMEYDGLYFLSHGFYNLYDGTPKGYLTFIAAHETAHQWWYGLVGNDQALEPWLDEALCTYMESIFYENIYAEYPASTDLTLVDWWWYYRVNFYDPTGPVNGTIYDFASFYSYRNAVYLNGARFLDSLRSLIGDQAFFAFLRGYAQQYRYRIATAADFFALLGKYTSEDVNSLVAEYFQPVR